MFRKFNYIDNLYNEKELNKFIDIFPEICTTEFIVWEKLDGSNIQIAYSNEKLQVCSRNRSLPRTEGFFGVWNILNEHRFSTFIDTLKEKFVDFNIYGEIYGKGIQNRVYYGESQYIKFYMMRLNSHIISAYEFIYIMNLLGFSDLVCPYNIVNSLQEAIEFDVEKNSIIYECEYKNIMEGIIFYPYKNIYRMPNGSMFIFKKKSCGFAESCKKKLFKVKDTEELDSNVVQLNSVFKTYINENRILSAFSKEGRHISNVKEIGYWHSIIFNDAKDDFIKDYGDVFDTIPYKQKKGVFLIKSLLANMLREMIHENK